MYICISVSAIHCRNRCTDVFYNCVIFVMLNKRKSYIYKEEKIKCKSSVQLVALPIVAEFGKRMPEGDALKCVYKECPINGVT